jgi:hypothetical protein
MLASIAAVAKAPRDGPKGGFPCGLAAHAGVLPGAIPGQARVHGQILCRTDSFRGSKLGPAKTVVEQQANDGLAVANLATQHAV